METQQAHEIKELIGECDPGCKCHGRGLEKLCKARDIGLETFVECLEDDPFGCSHAICYGTMFYCSCPPRVEIAKRFEKTA